MIGEELTAYIVANSYGTVANTFIGILPDTPDAAIAVLEYPGMTADYVQSIGGPAVEKPRAQVLVRGAKYDYLTPRTLAKNLAILLDFANATLSGTRYLRCKPLQPPYELRRDDQSRVYFAFNLEVEKLPS